MKTNRQYLLAPLILLLWNVYSLSAQPHIATDSGYVRSFDGTKIFYETFGSGFPVVLIHGFIVNGNSWKHTAVFDSLIAAGNKVVILDMRGNGKSDKPHEDAAYENDAEAKDIILLMKHLKASKYNVVGYSRGSIITARLLLRDRRVHKAVIGGMGTDFLNPDWPRRIMFYEALAFDTISELHALVKHTEQPGFDRRALALLQKYQPSADSADLKKVSVPVLVIKGRDDIYSSTARQLSLLFSRGNFTVVPGDHDRAVTTSEFAKAVTKFFRE